MNILQINTADTRGGAAKVAYRLDKELEKIGHQTSVFVGQKFSDDKNVFLLNDKKSFAMRVRKKLAYYFANDIDLFSSDKILKTREFREADIIHCHNLHSYYFNLNTLKKISRLKPVVWTFHDMWPITAHCAHSFGGALKDNGFFTCPSLEIFPPLAWHNEKYLESNKKGVYENSKFHIVTPSRWLGDLVGRSILKNRLISLIYNGIDTNIFKPYPREEIRHKLNLPNDKKIILSVMKKGQSNPWKGTDYANIVIESFKENINVVFINIGSSDDKQSPNTISIPRISDEGILAQYYSAADLLLYPSIADNCPLVALEAQACGLPLVAFKTGGIPEIIGHKKTGFIAGYKNTGGLIEGINHILNLGLEDYDNLRKNSIKNVEEKFTLAKMTDSYLKLYEDLIHQFRR